MKENFFSASLAAVSLIAVGSCAPALADGPVQVKLDDGSHFYKAPLQVQLINDGVTIRDHRFAPAEKIYQFDMPPMPLASAEIVRIGSRKSNGNGANPITIKSDYLPQAEFGSNIPAHSIGRNLPQGNSTSGLKNTNIVWSGQRHPIASHAVPQSTQGPRQSADGPIRTATYFTPHGGTTSSVQTVKTGVIGEVKKYSLLKN